MANTKLGRSPRTRYKAARESILVLLILTVVNCVLYLLGSDRYYVASIMLVYYFFELDPISLAISIVILVPYTLSFFLSKKNDGWIIVALTLFCIDLLFVLFLALNGFLMILDIIIHVLLIVELAIGVKNRRLGVMSDEQIAALSFSAAPPGAIWPEIECSAGVAASSEAGVLPYDGVFRFEERELVLGMASHISTALIGDALTPLKEKARVPYENITGVVKDSKLTAAVRLLLSTGGYLYAFPPKSERERFFSLLSQHGVSIHVFDGLEE